MFNLIIGITFGIFIAEFNGVPIILEYLTELLNAFNQLKEE